MPRPDFAPTPAQLRAFCKVAEHRSFTAAAAELGQSQPSLSQALALLEAGLDTYLLRRGGRRLELTPEGERLLPFARASLSALDNLVSAAANPEAGAPLRLGIIPTAAPYVISPLLSGIAAYTAGRTPLIVENHTADLIDALRAGEIDAALVALPAGASGIHEVPLYTERFVLAVPPEHPLADLDRVPPARLDDETMLLLDQGHCLREQTLDLCRENNARVLGTTSTRISSLATAVRCVAAGLGVTVLPVSASREAAGTGARLLEFTDPVPVRTMGLATRSLIPQELVDTVRGAVQGPAFAGVDVLTLPAIAD